MQKNYIWILVIFFMLMGPGPIVLFLNKYTITILPLVGFSLVIWLLWREIREADFNAILKKRETWRWTFEAFKYGVFAQAAATLLFRPEPTMPENLMQTYGILIFSSIVFGPIVEEIVYRKIIFGELDRRMNFWAAAAISTAIFAISHFNPGRLIGYIGVGLAFCFAYKKSGSLVPTITAHMALNFISIFWTTLKV